MQCANDFCNSTNIYENYDTGDHVCHDCGCCQPNAPILVHQIPRSQIFNQHGTFNQGSFFQDGVVHGSRQLVHRKPFNRKRKRNVLHRKPIKQTTYKRLVYFREKISQWRCLEPVIPYDDWLYIWDEYHESIRRPLNTCKQVTNLLKRIMRKYPDNCKHFMKKYGERWRSIRFRLTGRLSTGMFKQVNSKLIQRLINDFCRIEDTYKKQGPHVNKERRSLPSYNMILRELLREYGYRFMLYDIPQLKSKTKRVEIMKEWKHLCTN